MTISQSNNDDEKIMETFCKYLEDEKWRKRILDKLFPDYVRRDELTKILEELKRQREESNQHFEELITNMNKRFEAVDRRFEAVDRRFEAVDRRFEELITNMNKRFEEQDKRMDKRFNKVFERFNELSSALGHDFEEFNSYWLQTFLEELGYPKIEIQKKVFYDADYEVFPDSKEVEIDLFNEDPLIIGEVTAIVRSIDKVTTFLRKISFLEKRFGPAKHKLFITYSIRPEIRDEALKLLQDAGVKVIILRGRRDDRYID